MKPRNAVRQRREAARLPVGRLVPAFVSGVVLTTLLALPARPAAAQSGEVVVSGQILDSSTSEPLRNFVYECVARLQAARGAPPSEERMDRSVTEDEGRFQCVWPAGRPPYRQVVDQFVVRTLPEWDGRYMGVMRSVCLAVRAPCEGVIVWISPVPLVADVRPVREPAGAGSVRRLMVLIGVFGGTNFSSLAGADDERFRPLFGVQGGAYTAAMLPDGIGLQVEAMAIEKGARLVSGGEGSDAGEGAASEDVRLRYVEVPVLLRVGSDALHVVVGRSVAQKVGCRITEALGAPRGLCDAVAGGLARRDGGWVLGGGLSHAGVGLEYRFIHGTRDVGSTAESMLVGMRNRTHAAWVTVRPGSLPLGL